MRPLIVAPCIVASLVMGPRDAQAQDGALELRRGDRVMVEGVTGSLHVQAWERGTLALVGPPGLGDVVLRREGNRVLVTPGDRKGRARSLDVHLRAPAWAELEVQGRTLDVRVTGMAAHVEVSTLVGDVVARGTTGTLALSTLEGAVEVREGRGRISARSRSGDVTLVGVEGTVEASTVSGDLRLEDVRASSVRAETLAGDLYFRGPLATGGTYRFSVHAGDAEVVIPADAGARVRASTFDGELRSDFPVTLRRYAGGGMFDFTLGNGGAELEVRVFDGEIRLRSGGR